MKIKGMNVGSGVDFWHPSHYNRGEILTRGKKEWID